MKRDKMGRFLKGETPPTCFKIGNLPWNKGLTGKKSHMFGKPNFNKGKHITHPGQFKKGNKTPFPFKKGHVPWHKGKHILLNTGRTHFKEKEKHPNWQGGKSFEEYGLNFDRKLKEQIRKRDDYQCRKCFKNQSTLKTKLSIHHIDFDKKNNSHSNLISLCKKCHALTQFNKDYWINYFNGVLNEQKNNS